MDITNLEEKLLNNIKEMNSEKLKKDYENACMNYIKAFEEKQGCYFEFWAADRVGEVASFGEDFCFNFPDIKFDIDNKIEKGKIFEWIEYCLDLYELNKRRVNYESYLIGAR